MKTINFNLLAVMLFSIFLFVQCEEAAKKTDDVVKGTKDIAKKAMNAMPNFEAVTVTDTISKFKFNKWVNAWKADGVNFTNNTLLEFFTMNKVDLTQVMAEPGMKKARFYLGLDTSIVPNEPHLIVVAVDSLGNDMLDYNNGQYAYDVTTPCPIMCSGGHGHKKNTANK